MKKSELNLFSFFKVIKEYSPVKVFHIFVSFIISIFEGSTKIVLAIFYGKIIDNFLNWDSSTLFKNAFLCFVVVVS